MTKLNFSLRDKSLQLLVYSLFSQINYLAALKKFILRQHNVPLDSIRYKKPPHLI
ncbi:protein of unknown function [Maridesulfovibrio hydrothermalis AM13 = DSM 14728]|uniref:Uncharacterized protein n=1 Tax=Maridesulfovibrio hydrothermalis AM13 = DSM 14728 TaxID=1121451 RepID=L0RB79_9BACT|nr:protein of unknown function [Maridesulfovibrio hydrothermalis AM13 = DSM 14728]